jgi:aspartyl/glutamyl-tRNA(Asn/Gln) amidotransferase C subunit
MAVFPAQAAMLEIETKYLTDAGVFPVKMKVTEKDVAYVADLANLELTEKERSSMLRDLNSIPDYIDRLNQLDTTDVSPMNRKPEARVFFTASEKTFSKVLENHCRMTSRCKMLLTRTERFSKFPKSSSAKKEFCLVVCFLIANELENRRLLLWT